MAFVYKERVRESSVTTGTGPYALAGAPDSTYQTLAAAMADGDTSDFIIRQGAEWFSFLGEFDADAGELAVVEVYEGTNGTSEVNFGSGTKDIFMELPAKRALDMLGDIDALDGAVSTLDGRVDGHDTDIAANTTAIGNRVRYDAAQTLSASEQAQARANVSAALKGHIYGLTLANNGTDANNDIDIAAGEAASSESSPVLMSSSGLTKRLDANWAVGTNQGGLDTGSKANTTWYHVWLIQRSDTGVVDVLFSTSATSPTMPANYDRKRRIGAILTDGSGIIYGFTQTKNKFQWDAPHVAYNSNPGTSATLIAMDTPAGVISTWLGSLASVVNRNVAVTSPLKGAITPSQYGGVSIGTGTNISGVPLDTVTTDTSRQIRVQADVGGTLYVGTRGWIDPLE